MYLRLEKQKELEASAVAAAKEAAGEEVAAEAFSFHEASGVPCHVGNCRRTGSCFGSGMRAGATMAEPMMGSTLAKSSERMVMPSAPVGLSMQRTYLSIVQLSTLPPCWARGT